MIPREVCLEDRRPASNVKTNRLIGVGWPLRRRVSDAGPLRDGRVGCGAGVRKPPKEETAGRLGAGWAGAPYGDFGVTDQALVALRELVTRIVRGGREDGEPF